MPQTGCCGHDDPEVVEETSNHMAASRDPCGPRADKRWTEFRATGRLRRDATS